MKTKSKLLKEVIAAREAMALATSKIREAHSVSCVAGEVSSLLLEKEIEIAFGIIGRLNSLGLILIERNTPPPTAYDEMREWLLTNTAFDNSHVEKWSHGSILASYIRAKYSNVKSLNGVRGFVADIIRAGVQYIPCEPFNDMISANGKKFFTADEAKGLDEINERCWKVCESKHVDINAIALREMEKHD